MGSFCVFPKEKLVNDRCNSMGVVIIYRLRSRISSQVAIVLCGGRKIT
jgi:hypothetical protein